MKKSFLLALIATFSSAPVLADASANYVKKNGIVTVQRAGGVVEFEMASNVGQNRCSIDGRARFIDANRAAYTSDDNSDKCVVLLDFTGGKLAVLTKDCEGYCGMNAAGSMDGAYTLAE